MKFSYGVPVALAAILLVAGGTFVKANPVHIQTQDEMPTHSYPVKGTVLQLVQSPEELADLSSALRRDIENDLVEYVIDDSATLQKLHKCLLRLDLLERDYASALARLELILGLEEKAASRVMMGLVPHAIIALGKAGSAGELGDAALSSHAVFRSALALAVSDLPADLVLDRVKEARGQAEYLSEDLLAGVIESQVQPAVTAAGAMNLDLTVRLVHLVYVAQVELPLNTIIAEVYGQYIDLHTEAQIDIWAEREWSLPVRDTAEIVLIGIWDSGVDISVFPGQVWTNSAERADGQDTDDNGHVDDLHGIAYGLEGGAEHELLLPLKEQKQEIESALDFVQGFWDLVSAIDSPAAGAARKEISTLPASGVGDFVNTLGLAMNYLHGTHVAGIAVEGNPQARVLSVRATFDHLEPPRPVTSSVACRLAESFEETIAYFAANGARVVNMSWGCDYRIIESGLTAAGIGASAEERAVMARETLQIMADSLEAAMVSTPQILYVTAAGNEDGDVDFDLVIPSSFVLPNLIVVGAVDGAGNPAGFTSFGRNVKVYANGYQVESRIPGGQMMKGSGTSMSAPAVTNLAAKLLTLDPTLAPYDLIDLIERGADVHPDHPRLLRIDPGASAALLDKER